MNNLDGVERRSAGAGLRVGNAEDLRVQAEVCRQLGLTALKPEHSAVWMRLAQEWNLLAQAAEKAPEGR
jgi:hypothetical protein